MNSAKTFVVPQKPAAKMGWWIGEVMEIFEKNGKNRCMVTILRSSNGEKDIEVLVSDNLTMFDNLQDAIAFLKETGVDLSI